jgi:hypothetical protein
LDESQGRRRKALARADKTYGPGEVDRKLSALNRLDSHHPENRRKVRKDLTWNEARNPRSREEVVWVEGYYRSDGTWVKGHDRIVRKRLASRQIFI